MTGSNITRFSMENSTYEVDHVAMAVRRLDGTDEPTPRQGEDGQWRTFVEISPIVAGSIVGIVWQLVEQNGKQIAQMTQTSPVVNVEGSAADAA